MSPNDLLKLVRCGDFQVIRIRVGEGIFEIKRLQALMFPVWVVWYKCGDELELKFQRELLLSNPNMLDCTIAFSSSDLKRIQQQGFSIIRKCDVPTICIKGRNKDSGRWKIIDSFRTKEGRNQRISMMLQDNHTVLI